jgi:hypothetical protein
MHKPTPDGFRAQNIHRVALLLVYALAAGVMFVTWLFSRSINGRDCATFVEMVYGRACKPFVYRALLPALVRWTTAVLPFGFKSFLTHSLAQRAPVQHLLATLQFEPQHFTEYLVGSLLMGGSLLGFLFALRDLFGSLYHTTSWWFRDALPPAALLALRYLIRYVNYVYDLPTLFLFTLGLALMLRRQWRAFLLVYALACLNKETTILLTLVFVIHFLHDAWLDRACFVRLVLLQLGLFVAVKLALSWVFRANPGAFVELHLLDHNLDVLKSFLLKPSFAAEAPWFGVLLLTFYQWPGKPSFLKHALWIVVPIVAAMPLWGVLGELRVYYEAFPIVTLLVAHSLARLVGIPLANREELVGQTV